MHTEAVNIPADLLEDLTLAEKTDLSNALGVEEVEIGKDIEISDSIIEINGKEISAAKNTPYSISKMHLLSHSISYLDYGLLKQAETLLNETYPKDHKHHNHEGIKARREYIEKAKGHPLNDKEKQKLTSFIQEFEEIIKINHQTQKRL